MASIRKRSEGSYEIAVSLGYTKNGKKVVRYKTYRPDPMTKTGRPKSQSVIEKEVAAYAEKFESMVKNGELPEQRPISFEIFCDRYIDEYVNVELSGYSREAYAGEIRNRLIPEFGTYKIDKIGALTVQHFYNELAKKKKADGTLYARATLKKSLTIMSSIMEHGVIWGYLKDNPCHKVRIPKGNKRSSGGVKCFTPEEAQRFLYALESSVPINYKPHDYKAKDGKMRSISGYQRERRVSTQMKLFFTMALFGGFRRGELLALTWDDIDFENGIVTINKGTAKSGSKIITKDPKSDSGFRKVAMPSQVFAVAHKWKKEYNEARIRLGEYWKGTGNVFIQSDGSMMYPDTPTAEFRKIIKYHNESCKEESEKLPNITLHGLRHTHATMLISQNTDVKTVSKRLGHANTSTTLNIYAHALEDLDKEAAKTVDSLISIPTVGK